MKAYASAVVLMSTMACEAPPSPSVSPHAAELDVLERQLPTDRSQAAPAVDQSADAAIDDPRYSSTTTITKGRTPGAAIVRPSSPEFLGRFEQARRFLDEQLPVNARTGRMKEYDGDLTAARQLVANVRETASTPAERNLALLLTAIVTKDKERHYLAVIGIDTELAAADSRTLAGEAGVCRAELPGWLQAARNGDPPGASGSCLQEMQAAAALLTGRR